MKGEDEEFELKLELDNEGLSALADSPALAELTSGKVRRRELKSTYFDTPDHRLNQAGFTLRVRDVEGRHVQTVKLGTAMHGGISNPIEVEARIDGKTPDAQAITDEAIRERLCALADFGELKPVFSTEINRTDHPVTFDGARAELSLDSGQLRTPRKVRPLCEAELELKSGNIDAFLAMATRLFANTPIRFSTLSKAQRGYRQLSRTPRPPRRPANAWRAEFDGKESVSGAFALICQSACDQILANWSGSLDEDDPEFVHQLRIGLRRQRTALRVFRRSIDNEALRALGKELGHVGRVVGHLRNLDVMVEDIVRPALEHGRDPEAIARLGELIAGRCRIERRRVKHELRLRRWNPLLLRLSLLPHGAGWARTTSPKGSLPDFLSDAIDHCWHGVKKQADRLESLSNEQRHRLRKDLKVLRYAVEFFSPIMPADETKGFVRQLKLLQDRFGYLNDVVLARSLPDLLAREEADDPRLAEAIGFVLGWHSARAGHELADAGELWKRLKKQDKPWR